MNSTKGGKVYFDKKLVGELLDSGSTITFTYTKSWLESDACFPISPKMPLTEETYSGDIPSHYFGNLLAETPFRRFLGKLFHVDYNDVVKTLTTFTGDHAGALTILPRKNKNPEFEDGYIKISEDEILTYLQDIANSRHQQEFIRAQLSLAGAQDKLAIYIDASGEMYIPKGNNAKTTHILKPEIGSRFEHIAINEVFVMKLAKKIGMEVPDVFYNERLKSAIIQRYDRVIDNDGKVKKLHQYDLCQALGLASREKYEADGGPTFKDCYMHVIQTSANPIQDSKRLQEWFLYNFAVGNRDNHSKNISMIRNIENRELRLAPFYDMLSTTYYRYQLDTKLVFKVAKKKDPNFILSRHWEAFAESLGVSFKGFQKLANNVCESIMDNIGDVQEELAQTIDNKTTQVELDKMRILIFNQTLKLHKRLSEKI